MAQKLSKITKRKKKTLADVIEKVKNPAPGLTLTHVNGKAIDGAEEPKPPRQGMIPGTEPPHYKELGGLAQELADAKEACKSAIEAKRRREESLIAGMKKRGVKQYVDRGLNIEIILEAPDRVKVKKYNHREEKEDHP